MRLINADNLIRHKFPPERSNDEFARGWNTAIDAIVHNVPEVVANPTVYGRWIEVSRTEYEYEIEAENYNEYAVKEFCTGFLRYCKQTRAEWKRDDANSYFHGYYEFSKISENKYRYYVKEPFCD